MTERNFDKITKIYSPLLSSLAVGFHQKNKNIDTYDSVSSFNISFAFASNLFTVYKLKAKSEFTTSLYKQQ